MFLNFSVLNDENFILFFIIILSCLLFFELFIFFRLISFKTQRINEKDIWGEIKIRLKLFWGPEKKVIKLLEETLILFEQKQKIGSNPLLTWKEQEFCRIKLCNNFYDFLDYYPQRNEIKEELNKLKKYLEQIAISI